MTAKPDSSRKAEVPKAGKKAAGLGPGRKGAARLRTLLYIEDNPANMTLVEEIIARRPDMRLLTAVDALRGIELARASLPELILMDINLPEVSGIDALTILRSDPATAHIPVIALTAKSMESEIQFGAEVGFFNYLTKPFKIKEFMEALDKAFDSVEANKNGPGC
jgi:CheY-like chemotaxis protein